MLKGIDPILTGELLMLLDRMGHSDLVVVSDAHFPAHRLGPPVIEVARDVPRVVRAVRSVLEWDDVSPLALMDSGVPWNTAQREIVEESGLRPDAVVSLDRAEFYERAASAQLVVRTTDTRTFANAVLAKGVTPGGEEL